MWRIILFWFLICPHLLVGQQSTGSAILNDEPKGRPLLRPEMKQMLEALKTRQPRLPVPNEGEGAVINGRARAFYLPESWTGGPRPAANSAANSGANANAGGSGNRGAGRNTDTAMTLDNTFKVRLFWIVSRVNNCHYCLGHQELKLSRAGMLEDQIAALDSDWSSYPENEQAAFAFTRKLTLEPHLIAAADIEALRKFYSEQEVVEIVQTVAGFNSTNRWTDALGLPQDQAFGGEEAVLLTATSAAFQNRQSTVVVREEPARPEWESRETLLENITACRVREPRVALSDLDSLPEKVRQQATELGVENYAAALAVFPTTAARQVQMLHGIVHEGRTPTELRAMIFWAVARENRGWYLLGHAGRWLESQGISSSQMLDYEQQGLPETRQQLAFDFAKKLTSHSRQITDQDIASLRKHYSDHEVAEIVYLVCFANAFSHLAESVGLPLER